MSPRELQVISLVAQGMTNYEIGRKLFIAPSTVRSHLANSMEKLEACNRTNLVYLAMKKGLIQDD